MGLLKGTVGREFDVWQVWRDKSASQVLGKDLYCGHFLPEEAPEETASELLKFLTSLMRAMKLATFNINNINRRLPNLLRWLKDAKPDVVCMQELKCTDEAFPAEAISKAGYHAAWRGQRTWNGVAILARSEPVVTRTELPGDVDDNQARYIEAAIDGILVGCIYLPNGNPQPGPKFDYKLDWFRRLTAHARKLLTRGYPRRAGRRLQRGADGAGYLPDDIVG